MNNDRDERLRPRAEKDRRRREELFSIESAVELPDLMDKDKVDLLVANRKISHEKAWSLQDLLAQEIHSLGSHCPVRCWWDLGSEFRKST